MASKSEIIIRAKELAQRSPNVNAPALDGPMTAEAIYPHAMRYAVCRGLDTGRWSAQDYCRDHELEFANSIGTLPDAVLRRHLRHAHLRDYPDAALIDYPMFNRTRFDNLLEYFSIRNDKVYFSLDVPEEIDFDDEFGVIASSGSFIVGHNGAADPAPYVEQRIQLLDNSNAVVFDSIIDAIVDASTFNIRGQALSTYPVGLGVFGGVTLFDVSNDVIQRSLTNVTTVSGSVVVGCLAGAFTAADIGRRLKVMNGSTVVLDGYIQSVPGTTTVNMSVKALSTRAAATADVIYSPLVLNAPSLPDIPTISTDDLGISEQLADDAIVAIAGVLTGELSMQTLLAYR